MFLAYFLSVLEANWGWNGLFCLHPSVMSCVDAGCGLYGLTAGVDLFNAVNQKIAGETVVKHKVCRVTTNRLFSDTGIKFCFASVSVFTEAVSDLNSSLTLVLCVRWTFVWLVSCVRSIEVIYVRLWFKWNKLMWEKGLYL